MLNDYINFFIQCVPMHSFIHLFNNYFWKIGYVPAILLSLLLIFSNQLYWNWYLCIFTILSLCIYVWVCLCDIFHKSVDEDDTYLLEWTKYQVLFLCDLENLFVDS